MIIDKQFDALYQLYTGDLSDALRSGAETLHFETGIIGTIQNGALTIQASFSTTDPASTGQTFPLTDPYYMLPVMRKSLVKLESADDLPCAQYLGAPLCVMDNLHGVLLFSSKAAHKTSISEDDVKFFEILTQWVSHKLTEEQAKVTAELLKKTQNALSLSQKIARLGYWRWTLDSNELEWSEEHYRVFGFEPYAIQPSYEVWAGSVVPEDRARVTQIVLDAPANAVPFVAEYYIQLPNGERRYISSPGYPEFDETGKVIALFGIAQDITGRKQAEERLKRSENALRASQKVARLGHWRWDIATNEVEWSEEQYRVFGLEPNSVEPNYEVWQRLIAPEDRERMAQVVQNAAISGEPYEAEYYTQYPTGERRFIYAPGYPELDENGKVVAIFGISQDIHERKQAEEKLKGSESALRASQKYSKLGHWRWHLATNKVDWSEEHYIKHGYEPYSIEPDYYSWLNAVAPQDRDRAHQIVSTAAQQGIPFETEYFIETPDGVQRYNYAAGYPEFDENGKMISMFGVAQDITERKLLEDQLRDRTRDLEIAMEVSKQVAQILNVEELVSVIAEHTRTRFSFYHVSVFAFNEQENTLVYQAGTGQAAAKMKEERRQFHLSSDEKGIVVQAARLGTPVLINDVEQSTDHLKNPNLPDTRSEMALPMLLGSRLVGVLDIQSTQVNRFSAEDTRVLSSLAEQLAIALENARLYAQQERAAQELRRVDKLKSQFLANMSHELRTPLNAILNFTHFVATEIFGPVNDEQRENLQKVTNSATHLLDLINDILDLSKIEAGMMNLFIEPVDLNPFMKNVIATAQGLERAEGVELIIDIEADLPVLSVDKRRIRQILLNLISNAIKFTEQGCITVTGKRQDQHILFTVTDTGEGIEPEHVDLIFEAFKQTDVGMSKGGTGLGLPISRYLAEAHGGKLWVTSQVGQGSTFHMLLPIHTNLAS